MTEQVVKMQNLAKMYEINPVTANFGQTMLKIRSLCPEYLKEYGDSALSLLSDLIAINREYIDELHASLRTSSLIKQLV